MKIGILTLPLHSNYGGIVQAYALQTVLNRMGHDVVVFQNGYDGIVRFPKWEMPIILGKRFLRKCLTKSKIPVFLEHKRISELPVVNQYVSKFILDHINTYHIKSLNDIPRSEFDAIVVGSDQIWRCDYAKRIWNTDIQNVFLRFALDWNIKRVAYAVSFGKDELNYTQIEAKECASLAKLFDGISVREDSGVDLCLKYLDVKAEIVLDPTMLLTTQDYIKLIKDYGVPKNDGSLFAYILDSKNEKKNFVDYVANERNMKTYSIVDIKDYSQSINSRIKPPVEQWLRGFYDAEFVITDSFHGCVFSIIFNKPFIAIGNSNRGMSRFLSLLKMFGLEDHLILDINDYTSEKSYGIPDDIKERFFDLKEKSRNYLFQYFQ